jgi:hypothetical protein
LEPTKFFLFIYLSKIAQTLAISWIPLNLFLPELQRDMISLRMGEQEDFLGRKDPAV